MRLQSLKIKNLRTITDEQTLNFSTKTTLVGANNSGKSNTLRAIQYFFTGYENKYSYNHLLDLPYNLKGNGQTTLVAQFEIDILDSKDAALREKLKRLTSFLPDFKGDGLDKIITIYLTFRRSSPSYQLYPGQKQDPNKKMEFGVLQKSIVQEVLDRYSCFYIPSEKSIAKIYRDMILPFVKKEVAKAILPFEEKIKSSIIGLSDSMNSSFADAGISNVMVSLEYPDGIFDNLFAGLELSVCDSSTSSLYSKGMGLQSTVLFSALEWVTQQHSDSTVIWLIEEPETYMHPSLAYNACKILDRVSKISMVVRTTHSLSFMPGDASHINAIGLCGEGSNTLISRFANYAEATFSIRSSLGVRFSDYFGLSELNIFVEGETDEAYLKFAITDYELRNNRKLLIGSNYVRILSFGGCSELAGFLRANYENLSKEVIAVSLFDGDPAAEEQLSRLEGYFGTKGGFNSNRDYILVPEKGAIESVFPDMWVKVIHEQNSNWFESYRLDAAENIFSFKIKDGSKKKFMNAVLEYMRNPHHDEIVKLDIIVEALEKTITRRLGKRSADKLLELQSALEIPLKDADINCVPSQNAEAFA